MSECARVHTWAHSQPCSPCHRPGRQHRSQAPCTDHQPGAIQLPQHVQYHTLRFRGICLPSHTCSVLLSMVRAEQRGRGGREGHDRWTKIRYYLHATDFLVFIIPLRQIFFVIITVYMLVVEVSVMHSRREYYCNACVRCGRLILIPNHRFSNALQSNVTRKDIAGLL